MAAFGAFVELSPGLSGLLHASELRHSRGEGAEAVAAGNALQFVVLSVSRNEQGQPRIRLSQRGMYPEGPAPSTRRSPAQGEEGSTARGRGSAPVSAIRSAFRVSAKAGPEFGVAPDSPPPPSSAIARLRHWWEAQPSSRAPASTALGDALRRMGYAWPDADVEAESAEELPRARAGWTAELGRRVAAKATSLLPELDRLPRAFSVELARPPAPVSHRGFRVAEDSPAEHVRRLAPRAPVSMHERYVASAEANMDWRDMPLGEFARYLKERGEETVQGGDPFRPPLRPLGWFEPVLRRMPRHLRRAGGREAEDWTRRGALEAGTRAWSHLRVKLHGCLAPIPPSYPTRSILCRALPLDACAEASASPPRISAAAAAQLRARSGAGLMACKAALEEACGDFERAMDLLRLKGQSASAARAARTAAQGLLAAEVGPGRRAAACVELRCETDFVARAERFTSCARALARAALGLRGETGPEEAEDGLLDSPVDGLADASTVRGALDQLTLAVGEKVQLAGVRRWEVPQGAAGVFAAYVHAGSGCRDGVLLELRCSDAAAATDAQVWELADNMALQLVACPSVKYVRADQVPEPERARERAVLEEQEDVKARPEAMQAKIVQGRLGKALAEWSLMPQGYVLNPKQTVQQVLDAVSKSVGSELWVSRFVRISVGSSA